MLKKDDMFNDMILKILRLDSELLQWDMLSEFFHACKNYSKSDILNFMRNVDSKVREIKNEELRCVIGVLIEYTFTENGEIPPQWVNDKDFVFTKDKKEWFVVRTLSGDLFGEPKIDFDYVSAIAAFEKNQRPVFKKHNIPNHGFYNAV